MQRATTSPDLTDRHRHAGPGHATTRLADGDELSFLPPPPPPPPAPPPPARPALSPAGRRRPTDAASQTFGDCPTNVSAATTSSVRTTMPSLCRATRGGCARRLAVNESPTDAETLDAGISSRVMTTAGGRRQVEEITGLDAVVRHSSALTSTLHCTGVVCVMSCDVTDLERRQTITSQNVCDARVVTLRQTTAERTLLCTVPINSMFCRRITSLEFRRASLQLI